MTLESLLTNRITERIAKWDQHDIYAISLLVTYDELSVFHGSRIFRRSLLDTIPKMPVATPRC